MSWKKVVVSGSNAHLKAIHVGSVGAPADGAISASGKIFATTAENDSLSSFDVVIKGPGGEFMHTSSAAINPSLSALAISTGLLPSATNYDGSTGVTVSVDSGSIAGDGLNATTNSGHTAGFEVKAATNGAIFVSSAGVAVDTGSLAGSGLSANDSDIAGLAVGAMGVKVDGSTITINGSGQLQAAAGTLTNALTQGNGIQTFSYDGGTADVTVVVDTGSIAGGGLTGTAGDNGFTNNKISVKGNFSNNTAALKYNSGEFVETNITDNGSNAIALGDTNYTVTIPGNLTVSGRAEFVNSTNVSTADSFFLMKSGSSTDSAFGILGQTGGTTGTGWMYGGSSNKRFTMTKDASVTAGGAQGTLVGSATLLVNTNNTATALTDDHMSQNGNMLIDSNQNIFLYF